MARQNRHQAEDQREFAILRATEIEPHRQWIRRLCLGYFRIICAVIRAALVAQQSPGEQYVGGGDRLAVGKARPRIEMKGDVASRLVGLDASGEKPIKRKGLIVAACHQAFDRKAPDLLNGQSAHDERVEAVEGAENALHQPSALWRIGVGIGHMRESGGQRRFAVHGDRVAFGSYSLLSGQTREAETEEAAQPRCDAPVCRNPPFGASI